VGVIQRERLAQALKAEQEASPGHVRSSALADKLQTFMKQETWLASQRYLEEHAELLDEAADHILQDLIRTSRERGEEDYVQVFQEHREVLQRCHEVGVKQAFGEKIRQTQGAELEEGVAAVQDLVHAETWAETQDVLEAHPELLEERGDRLMGAFIEAARELGDEESEEILQEHRALLERCREVGMEEAFGERAGSEEGESEQSLVQALQAFVTAETWDEAEQIVEAHPDLLRDEVDEAIALLVDSALEEGEDATAIILQEHQRILQRCRQLGIGEAFAQEMGENDSGNGEK
jgi:2-oxo-4-hydroxy-4-carboxy--5-ureidoimidazoline (OHCU) decarboxylase